MSRITIGKLFELYIDTLNKCCESTKTLSDEMIEYNIFEEFIVGITSFFANKSLNELLENGLIDEQIYSESEKIRVLTLKLDGSSQWNISSFRNSESWREIMVLSDNIKEQIRRKWSEEEIQEIFAM